MHQWLKWTLADNGGSRWTAFDRYRMPDARRRMELNRLSGLFIHGLTSGIRHLLRADRCLLPLLAIALCLFIQAGAHAAGGSLDFVIIQPGQPGTPEEAQPVMDSFAAYVREKLDAKVEVTGCYFNDLEEAMDFMKGERPQWGIVSLGFYADHAADFQMTPIASTCPGGFSKDILRLAVSREAPDSWHSLQGTVSGTMLFVPDVAACELFASPLDKLPFKLTGTYQPLRSLRSASKGQLAGVVLDRLQYRSMQSLSVAGTVKIIVTSKELPTSPVVWFGPRNERTKALAAILTGMRKDADAANLLKILQTDGFGPVDPQLPPMRMDAADASCRP